MMVSMGAVSQGTPVVTIVHDCQVLLGTGQQGLRLHCVPCRAWRRSARLDSLGAAARPCPRWVWGTSYLHPAVQPTQLGPYPCQLLHPLLFDQVVDIPETLLEDHDLTVDYILTPTRVITTGCERPKPTGIVWSKVGHRGVERGPWLIGTCSFPAFSVWHGSCPQACMAVR